MLRTDEYFGYVVLFDPSPRPLPDTGRGALVPPSSQEGLGGRS